MVTTKTPLKIHGVYAHINIPTDDGVVLENITIKDAPLPVCSLLGTAKQYDSKLVGSIVKIWQSDNDILVNAEIYNNSLIDLLMNPHTHYYFQADTSTFHEDIYMDSGLYYIKNVNAQGAHIGDSPAWSSTIVRMGWFNE